MSSGRVASVFVAKVTVRCDGCQKLILPGEQFTTRREREGSGRIVWRRRCVAVCDQIKQ